jgi:class 3 adenylate cyclase
LTDTQEPTKQSLEIAHVLFVDIVAYSTLHMDRQQQVLRDLQEAIRNTPAFKQAQAEDELIRLPTGDGMALVFFYDPEAPVRCALELTKALGTAPNIKLRMGIHTGPVYRVADINANRNVSGGGINIAQRVMDCGDAGHILVSEAAADVLGQVSTWTGALQDLGETEVKHGLRIHIFSLCLGEVGNSATPTKLLTVSSATEKLNSRQKSSAQDAQQEPSSGSDRILTLVRPHFRTLLDITLVIVASLFVHGAALTLFKTLTKSDPHLSAYIATAVFAASAFFVLSKIKQKRRAGEQARKRLENWAQTSRSAAFRNLAPYSEEDSLPGTGRKRQARQLVTSIKDPSLRFGVVSGDVGCGKTSLLQSEVQRLLKDDNFTPILLSRAEISDAKDIADLVRVIRTAIASKQGSESRVLIVDQIEEILIRFPGKEAREAIGALFGGVIRGDRPCKIICAIRKDYFLDLYDLGLAMGVEVRPTLMLRNFTPEEAKEVIQECANQEGFSPTSDLIDSIVADLTKEGQVRPPELQIVCTALTSNFTSRHYGELGGANGLLQSYLGIAIETCIDQEMARLILRQMCDFERQAKADPKTVSELARAVGPQQDNLNTIERLVRNVLDHLVRSRLLVMIGGGKFGLIHDYWVSIIYEATIHDRSQQEKADELLRRHLRDQQAGFSSALGSKQLRLVQASADRDLLSTQESKKLIQKSVALLWIRRGISATIVITIVAGGLLSRTIIWQPELLMDLGGPAFARHLTDPERLIASPLSSGQNHMGLSSFSVFDIPSGKRISEVKADVSAASLTGNLWLYVDHGQTYSLDLNQNKKSPLNAIIKDAEQVIISNQGHCALHYEPTTDYGLRPDAMAAIPRTIRLLAMPEGKSIASTSMTAVRVEPSFVADTCDRAVFVLRQGVVTVLHMGGQTITPIGKPWLWQLGEARPKELVGGLGDLIAINVRPKAETLTALSSDHRGHDRIGIWDLRKGVNRVARDIELGNYWFAWLASSTDGEYLMVSYVLEVSFNDQKHLVLRSSDLQPAEATKDQDVFACSRKTEDELQDKNLHVIWSNGTRGGFIWDLSSKDPILLKGLEVKDIADCEVSEDNSRMVVLRKNGLAELWSITENRVSTLHAGGTVKTVRWSLEGKNVVLERDNGQMLLFDTDGMTVATLVAPGMIRLISQPDGRIVVSFRQKCGHILLLTSDGRLLKYSKKLKMFDLPFLFPVYSRGSDSACN